MLYAGYKSFGALKSTGAEDDKQWLTFWFLFTLFDFACTIVDILGSVIPFYPLIKLGFVIYIGPLNGASVVYPFLEPYLNQAEEAANALELDKKLAEQVKKAGVEDCINQAKAVLQSSGGKTD